MSHETILVIDDDPDIRSTLFSALELVGYDVLTASSGLEGLQVLEKEKEKIRCIILDVMMPNMNGFEFLERVKNHSASKIARIPVIVATAKGNQVDSGKLEHASARIQKPMDLDLLYQVVKDQVELLH